MEKKRTAKANALAKKFGLDMNDPETKRLMNAKSQHQREADHVRYTVTYSLSILFVFAW